MAAIEEKSLERMEALLAHSAKGVHALFDNQAIAKALSCVKDDSDFYDVNKMKKVEEAMTELVAKNSYIEKMAFLQALDEDSFQMLIRAYFHIVENTVRNNHNHH